MTSFEGYANENELWYYHQLPERLQRVYLTLLEAISAHEERVALPLVPIPDVERVLDVLVLEQPFVSYLEGYKGHYFNDLVFSLELEYLLPSETQEAVSAAVLAQAERVAEYARAKGNDPKAQVKAVHEFFVRRVVYDREHPSAFHAAGPLLYGRACCMGIALAFLSVLRNLEIPCIVCRGEHDGDPHAWSMVFLEGRWQPFDLTVDVCGSAEGEICFEGFGQLPGEENYQSWEAFPLPK